MNYSKFQDERLDEHVLLLCASFCDTVKFKQYV